MTVAQRKTPPGRGNRDGENVGGHLGTETLYTIEQPTANGAAWSGKRRKLPDLTPQPIGWPKTRQAKEETLRTWYIMAGVIASHYGLSFRLFSAFWRFVHWQDGRYLGALWPTNKVLSECCGFCSEKTIKNDIAAFRKLGLIITEDVRWPGNRFPTRIIRLCLPRELERGEIPIFLPDDHFQGEDSVPPENFPQREHSVPFEGENSVPPTTEGTTEKTLAPVTKVGGAK